MNATPNNHLPNAFLMTTQTRKIPAWKIPGLEHNGSIAFKRMTDKIVVLNTCGSEAEAERLARLLLDQRLAACVSIAPQLRSFYRWNGAVERSEEWLLLIKSSRPLFERLRAVLEAAHSYEVPEVLALPVVDGAAGYLDWMQANLHLPVAEGAE
jgi:periplasmic divalent cation tolerance protein